VPVEAAVLFGVGVAAEVAVILLSIRSRVFETLPAFFFYLCWNLLTDVGMFICLRTLSQHVYFRVYEVQAVIDTLAMFSVLVELGWSALRPIRASLPKHSWIGIAVLILVAGAVLWPIAGMALPSQHDPETRFFVQLQQIPSVLRVVVFFAMAGFSQLIGIGWRSRELQVATGLGFYAILSLAVTVFHTHQSLNSAAYHWTDVVGGVGYAMALSYWVYAFATKEAERQNFSPQMANFLLLLGGTAKAGRVALADFEGSKSRFKDH
jgi:hypothetical protein